MWVVLGNILIGLLSAALPSIIGRVLLTLGIGAVSYTGLTAGTTYLMTQVQSSFSGMPSVVLNFLGWCWVDHAVTLIASTFTACLSLKTLSTMNITKYLVKSPGSK